MISISVLDVGHGSCAVLHGDGPPSIVDGGVGGTLLKFLHEDPPDEIDTVVISHADKDHIAGLGLALKSNLLQNSPIRTVLVNPAQNKKTKAWKALVEHLEQRQAVHGTELAPLIAGDMWPVGDTGRCALEIMGPRYVRTLNNTNDNNMSGVVRIHVDDEPEILLPADIDSLALEDMLERNDDMSATIAVFPHHGGEPGGDSRRFARRLMEAVRPSTTMLSLGRRRFNNPSPSVMAGILSSGVPTHVGCTQLSTRCCDQLPSDMRADLSDRESAGKRWNECCTGTVTFEYVQTGNWVSYPPMQTHADFVSRFPTRLCKAPAAQ